jgi:hypothetical protein
MRRHRPELAVAPQKKKEKKNNKKKKGKAEINIEEMCY